MPPPLEAIWNEFADKLGWFIRTRGSDPATAGNILQDVFVNIHGRLDTLEDTARTQGWIYRITRNAIKS